MPTIDLLAPDKLSHESEARVQHAVAVSMVALSPSISGPAAHLVPEGTITFYIAPTGTPVLAEMRNALSSGDATAAIAISKKLAAAIGKAGEVSYDDAVALTIAQPVFADLRYGGKTLASAISVPAGRLVAALPLPYNGGPLALESFELVQHTAVGATESLEAIGFVRAPVLTEAESDALSRLPAEDQINCLGLCDYATGVGRTAFIVTAGVVTAIATPAEVGVGLVAATGAAAVTAAEVWAVSARSAIPDPLMGTGAAVIAGPAIVVSGPVTVIEGPSLIGAYDQIAVAVDVVGGKAGGSTPLSGPLDPTATSRSLLQLRRSLLANLKKA